MTETTTDRVYAIYVRSLCGSDDIMSNSEDSYCNECREWMNAEHLEVVPRKVSGG